MHFLILSGGVPALSRTTYFFHTCKVGQLWHPHVSLVLTCGSDEFYTSYRRLPDP